MIIDKIAKSACGIKGDPAGCREEKGEQVTIILLPQMIICDAYVLAIGTYREQHL